MALPADVVEACADLWQGDLVADVSSYTIADLDRPVSKRSRGLARQRTQEGKPLGLVPVAESATPCYVAIVSQTCDVQSSNENRAHLIVSPVRPVDDPADPELGEGRRQRAAEDLAVLRSGRLAHHVLLNPPDLEGYFYADLSRMTTIEKGLLVGKAKCRGFSTPEEYRHFSFRAGHVLDRPAVPYPADQALANPLRAFFTELQENDAAALRALEAEIGVYGLRLDHPRNPTQGQLCFLREAGQPSSAVKELLDGWWLSAVAENPEAAFNILPNLYDTLGAMNALEYRELILLNYWHLSEN